MWLFCYLQEADGHEGTKPQRVAFCSELGYLFTAGFSRMSARQYAVWKAVSLVSRKTVTHLAQGWGILFSEVNNTVQFFWTPCVMEHGWGKSRQEI